MSNLEGMSALCMGMTPCLEVMEAKGLPEGSSLHRVKVVPFLFPPPMPQKRDCAVRLPLSPLQSSTGGLQSSVRCALADWLHYLLVQCSRPDMAGCAAGDAGDTEAALLAWARGSWDVKLSRPGA